MPVSTEVFSSDLFWTHATPWQGTVLLYRQHYQGLSRTATPQLAPTVRLPQQFSRCRKKILHSCQPRVSQTTLALHVPDSNDKKVGNSTWVTTSESTKKNTCLYRQVQTRLPLSINNTQLTIAGMRTPRHVTNKTPPARVATPTWPHAARLLRHIIHDRYDCKRQYATHFASLKVKWSEVTMEHSRNQKIVTMYLCCSVGPRLCSYINSILPQPQPSNAKSSAIYY